MYLWRTLNLFLTSNIGHLQSQRQKYAKHIPANCLMHMRAPLTHIHQCKYVKQMFRNSLTLHTHTHSHTHRYRLIKTLTHTHTVRYVRGRMCSTCTRNCRNQPERQGLWELRPEPLSWKVSQKAAPAYGLVFLPKEGGN